MTDILKPHEAVRVLKGQHNAVIWQLEGLANALEVTGNSKLADKLLDIADQLAPLAEVVSKAVDADFKDQMAHSQAMSMNVLRLALSGAIGSNSHE